MKPFIVILFIIFTLTEICTSKKFGQYKSIERNNSFSQNQNHNAYSSSYGGGGGGAAVAPASSDSSNAPIQSQSIPRRAKPTTDQHQQQQHYAENSVTSLQSGQQMQASFHNSISPTEDYGGYAQESFHHVHKEIVGKDKYDKVHSEYGYSHGWAEDPGDYLGFGGVFGKNCNSALGLFGVLGFMSYLQSVLSEMLMQSTTTQNYNSGGGGLQSGSGRGRRSVNDDGGNVAQHIEVIYPQSDRIVHLLSPLLTAVAHARDGYVPLECTHRPLCEANRFLALELGDTSANFIGSKISTHIVKMFRLADPKGVVLKNADKIAKHGRNGGKCEIYQECSQLKRLPSYSLPDLSY